MEKYIYFISEEHSSGTDCCQHGCWYDIEKAKSKLMELVKENSYDHFNEDSSIDYEEGVAYSGNCDDDYTQYKIEKLLINDAKLPLDEFIEEEIKYRYQDAAFGYDQAKITEDFLNFAARSATNYSDAFYDYDALDAYLHELLKTYETKEVPKRREQLLQNAIDYMYEQGASSEVIADNLRLTSNEQKDLLDTEKIKAS